MSYENQNGYQNGNDNFGDDRYRDYGVVKKKRKVIIAACAAICVLALFGLMCIGFLGFAIFKGELSILASGVDKGYLVKQESVSMSDARRLNLDVPFHKVYVNSSNEDDLKVRQYGPENLSSEDQFILRKNSNRINIEFKKTRFKPSTINIGNENIIELDIPKSWVGSVYLTTSSGSMLIDGDFTWGSVEFKSSSGFISTGSTISCSDISISSSSGNIDVKNALTSSNSISLKSSSGQIKVSNTLSSENIYIKSNSGSVNVDKSVLNARNVSLESTSGGISGNTVNAYKYDIESTSGNINFINVTGYGRLDCTSGSINIEKLIPTGDTRISSVSGSVNFSVPKKLSFNFIGSTTSGSINTDFNINYKDDRKRSASAAVGNSPFIDLTVKSTSGSINIGQYN